MSIKNFTRRKGFTLIEALVAVTILVLSVGGPLWSANRALVVAGNSRNRLTATYLAQEGIEHVRMVRDNEYLKNKVTQPAWDDFKDSLNQCSSGCALDPLASGGNGTFTGTITPLKLDGNKYQLALGTLTPFTRTIYIKDVAGTDDEIQVVSKVEWSFHNVSHSVTVVNYLTKWQ